MVLGVAAVLRLQQLDAQWLIDDEWHALHMLARTEGYAALLTTFGHADFSIPLALYDRVLASTVGLNEWGLRLPMLVSGLLLVGLALAWARRALDAPTALVFGFLLAVSAALVAFSRMARPYMPGLLLACVALWALARWTQRGGRRWLAVYIGCTWLASWLHLLLAPFLLAPLLVLLWRRWRRPATCRVSLPRTVALGSVTTALILAVALPPLLADWAAMGSRTGSDWPTGATLWGVWFYWLGSKSSVVVGVGLLLAVAGWRPLAERCGLLLAFWVSGLLAVLAVILLMRPAWVHNPLTFGRYLLPALPLLLLLVAAGIRRLSERLPRLPAAAAMVAGAGLFLFGSPHRALLAAPNAFHLHLYYQLDWRPRHNPARAYLAPYAEPSPFWARFAADPPGRWRIAVTGAPSFESFYDTQVLYQPQHRQHLVKLQTSGACGPDRLGEAFAAQGVFLRNAVSLRDTPDLRAAGIDWVVIDTRMAQAVHAEGLPGALNYQQSCMDHLRRRLGPPVYTDVGLSAYSTASDRGPLPADAGSTLP